MLVISKWIEEIVALPAITPKRVGEIVGVKFALDEERPTAVFYKGDGAGRLRLARLTWLSPHWTGKRHLRHFSSCGRTPRAETKWLRRAAGELRLESFIVGLPSPLTPEPKVRTQCGSSARWVPRGGQLASGDEEPSLRLSLVGPKHLVNRRSRKDGIEVALKLINGRLIDSNEHGRVKSAKAALQQSKQ